MLSHLTLNEFKIDYLIDLSSLLTVFSLLVRNILSLRILAVGAQLCVIPYFWLQATPLWPPIRWNSLFILINLCHIWLLLLERRPVKLTLNEQQLYDLAFQPLEPREFIQLLALGEWKNGRANERIMANGKRYLHFSVITSGKAIASIDDKKIGELKPGELIGTACSLIGEDCHIDVDFSEDSSYIQWSIVELRDFLNKNQNVRLKFADIVNRDLADKVNNLANQVY